MGQKHSKRQKKMKAQPEVTEIIELNDNQSEIEDDSRIERKPSEELAFPSELNQAVEAVDRIEKTIEAMTTSQIDLYYATLKDDLHNHWQKLYKLADHGDEVVKARKIEAIDRLKIVLRRLNGKVLTNGHAVNN